MKNNDDIATAPVDDTVDSTSSADSSDTDIMELSDEDFLKAPPPESIDEDESSKTEDTVEDTAESVDEDSAATDESDSTVDSSPTDADESGDNTESDSVSESGNADESADSPNSGEDVDKKDYDVEPESKDSTDANVDYKAEYEKVMAPFQANGVEMKPKSIEDIVRLMQMGANYHQKMAGLKPSMKVLKLLENNELLDQDKLNFLIDLHNKKPEAITKLLKDSGMDPLDIDTQKNTDYTPTNRSVTDAEIELDTVLDSIKDTPTYHKTLNIVTKEWDTNSREMVAKAPSTLAILNQHVAEGIYDKVMGAVLYERSLGNLAGISDFDAYKQIGDQLWNQGEIGPKTTKSATPAVPPVKPKKSSTTETKRKAQKKAAGPTGHQGKTAATPDFNPLAMSDEEIAKFDMSKLDTFR